ncbi:MAG: hypothetical protein C3F13_16930 [Anaerolineales bacterium]|nr:hypothetical protein [Anaerolineae bacterium]PWB50304.1 MAG: hypothetical protein C3F13_16930 [Anaerolineales bacterium]
MPMRKVGIIACSGEELEEGTVTRLAALRVLEHLRPNETVTLCLPLFLAGGEGDRAFARFHPTIAVDGCELRCAQKATERYSNRPAASYVVRDVIAGNQLGELQGRRKLNAAGLQAVDLLADEIAQRVDELLGKQWNLSDGEFIQLDAIGIVQQEASGQPVVATCACGSGIPIQEVLISGELITLVGIPLIFQQFTEAGKFPSDENLNELMETVKVYNPVPDGEEMAYREGISRAYADFWFKEKNK